ncbi:hypothetical protein TUN205_11095 [Pyrenophora tritici-repentis]|nr:hypothetical protein TUN205_11095 [Pyrenophora tritici-repentis]
MIGVRKTQNGNYIILLVIPRFRKVAALSFWGRQD